MQDIIIIKEKNHTATVIEYKGKRYILDFESEKEQKKNKKKSIKE